LKNLKKFQFWPGAPPAAHTALPNGLRTVLEVRESDEASPLQFAAVEGLSYKPGCVGHFVGHRVLFPQAAYSMPLAARH
jgi:hypothetical protein